MSQPPNDHTSTHDGTSPPPAKRIRLGSLPSPSVNCPKSPVDVPPPILSLQQPSVASQVPFSTTMDLSSDEEDSLGAPNHSDHCSTDLVTDRLGREQYPIDRSSFAHSLLLTHSGEVYGWGDNGGDKVLYHGPLYFLSPIKLSLSDIVAISAGSDHSFALSSEGKLYGWGDNTHGQINTATSSLHCHVITWSAKSMSQKYPRILFPVQCWRDLLVHFQLLK
ncbi:hypothetical protein P9112_006104 [Eukaryota sp. TZLM1-RC]